MLGPGSASRCAGKSRSASRTLAQGKARRRDGRVCDVLATVSGRRTLRRDPQGLTPDVGDWHPVL
jgi:hypothetical protein